jgi:hypothetical protein
LNKNTGFGWEGEPKEIPPNPSMPMRHEYRMPSSLANPTADEGCYHHKQTASESVTTIARLMIDTVYRERSAAMNHQPQTTENKMKHFYFDSYEGMQTSTKGKVYYLSQFQADSSSDTLEKISREKALDLFYDSYVDFSTVAAEAISKDI